MTSLDELFSDEVLTFDLPEDHGLSDSDFIGLEEEGQ